MRTKITFLSTLTVIFFNFSLAQNLVPNHDFESFTSCPTTDGELPLASPWIDPCGTRPDYFNSCPSAGVAGYGTPFNNNGNQTANSGVAYAGFFAIVQTAIAPDAREYLQVQLLSPLNTLTSYDVNFYVSLADNADYAVSSLGAYFSVTALSMPTNTTGAIHPQVSNLFTNPITDKALWTRISGSFIASGGEKYITIANFNTMANSDTTFVGPATAGYSYYYIDDISVAATPTISVNEHSKASEFSVYPNPAKNLFYVNQNTPSNSSYQLKNILGEEVVNEKLSGITSEINIASLPYGFYFLSILNQENNIVFTSKIIKQ